MASYIKINDVTYPAVVNTKFEDRNWDYREVKIIHLEMPAQQAAELFVDGINWYEVNIETDMRPFVNENGETVYETYQNEVLTSNADFCFAGEIVDHRDGTIPVKMGKHTPAELLNMLEEVL